MRKTLLFLWQLPQHIVALIVYLMCKNRVKYMEIEERKYYKYDSPKWMPGVSLGNYIFLKNNNCLAHNINTINHEFGHSEQSRCLGPLYLIIIGIPSALGNIYSRIYNKSSQWYYNQPWEKWADKLGGVRR